MTEPTPLPRTGNAVRLPLAREDDTPEREVERMLRNRPLNTRLHDLESLGRMSAEAVMTQYEATAKSVEEMGKTVRDIAGKVAAKLLEYDTDMKRMTDETNTMVRDTAVKLAEVLTDCDADLKIVDETAAAIREKGKHNEALIAQISQMSKTIREACAAFKKQMEA